jgi:hypothetical protein
MPVVGSKIVRGGRSLVGGMSVEAARLVVLFPSHTQTGPSCGWCARNLPRLQEKIANRKYNTLTPNKKNPYIGRKVAKIERSN